MTALSETRQSLHTRSRLSDPSFIFLAPFIMTVNFSK